MNLQIMRWKVMNKNIGDMTIDELKDFIIELQEENGRYERIIDKAIAYIEGLEENEWISFGRIILFNILKGDENDKNN